MINNHHAKSFTSLTYMYNLMGMEKIKHFYEYNSMRNNYKLYSYDTFEKSCHLYDNWGEMLFKNVTKEVQYTYK